MAINVNTVYQTVLLILNKERGRKSVKNIPQTKRVALGRTLTNLIDIYEDNWLARNRAGGFPDSVARLIHLKELLLWDIPC